MSLSLTISSSCAWKTISVRMIPMTLLCSEAKKRPDGRRKYLACNDDKATARQIVMGYRLRWKIELFHKDTKMHLGFEAVATTGFPSVASHVHWVYCAYLLLHMSPPGVPQDVKSVGERQ